MEVTRLAQFREPAYPDSSAASRDPALLMSLPGRWKRNAVACAALAATSAMLLSACGESSPHSPHASADPMAPRGPGEVATLPPGSGGRAVPLFEHGVGMGSYGCVAVAPPVFMSEAEAYSVIDEIARENGVAFTQDGAALKGVYVPRTNAEPFYSQTVYGYKKQDLFLDGVDEQKKVAFEFVSKADLEAWQIANPGVKSSAEFFSTISAAQALSDSLGRTDTGLTVAVFYDPNYSYDSGSKTMDEIRTDVQNRQAEFREQAKDDLRQQVLDFIAWLKAQGVI